MAKALLGYVATGPDVRLLSEVSRLRSKIRELEQELAEARAQNDRLASAVEVRDDELIRFSHPEHARL